MKKNNKPCKSIPLTDQLSLTTKQPLIVGWRAWLVKKLGGHILTGEERGLLMKEIWLPAAEKALTKARDKFYAELLKNSFTTNFTENEKT